MERLADGLQGFFEFVAEEQGGAEHGDGVRNGLCQVDCNGLVRQEGGQEVDEGDEQDELPKHRQKDRCLGIAHGDEGHLAGDLHPHQAHGSGVDAQDHLGVVDNSGIAGEQGGVDLGEQLNGAPQHHSVDAGAEQEQLEGFSHPCPVSGTKVVA